MVTPSQQAPLVERLKEGCIYRTGGDGLDYVDENKTDALCAEAAARITELEAANGRLARLGRALERELDKGFARAERAEAQCRVLQDALAPFAEAARLALIGGYPPVNFVGAVEFEHAAQALSLSGGGA